MRKIVFSILTAVGLCHAAVITLDQPTLKDYLKNGAPFDFILVDVRTKGEVSTAIGNEVCKPYNLPWPESLMAEADRIPRDRAIVIYCRSGNRSRSAAAYLSDNGFTRVYDAGGMLTWDGPTVPATDIKPATMLPEPSMRANPAANPAN